MSIHGFVALLLLLILTIGCTRAACPQGSFVGLDGSCYKVFAEKHTFFYAEEACASSGGHLASIDSAFENSFLRVTLLEIAPGSPTDWKVWIGARRPSNADSWSWTDGKPFVYSNWATDQSSSSGCAYISYPGTWSVSDCTSALSFFCEIPSIDEPKPTHWAKTGYTVTQWMQNTWIGFNTLGGATYAWSDGSPIDFTNWRPSQPDTQTQCAIMNADHGLTDELGTWDDVPCTLEARVSVRLLQ